MRGAEKNDRGQRARSTRAAEMKRCCARTPDPGLSRSAARRSRAKRWASGQHDLPALRSAQQQQIVHTVDAGTRWRASSRSSGGSGGLTGAGSSDRNACGERGRGQSALSSHPWARCKGARCTRSRIAPRRSALSWVSFFLQAWSKAGRTTCTESSKRESTLQVVQQEGERGSRCISSIQVPAGGPRRTRPHIPKSARSRTRRPPLLCCGNVQVC